MSIRYLFNTAGDYVAFQQGYNVFTPSSNWFGFVINGNMLYSNSGEFVGYVLNDDRVAKNTAEPRRPRISSPARPPKPLKPLKPLKRLRMPRLPIPYEDVFESGIVGTSPSSLYQDVSLESLINSDLYAADGVFLGKINKNAYDANSISNQYGQYGNPYSALSVFNEYSTYGNVYSHLSPFNEYSRTPPRFVKNGNLVAYLTANQFMGPRIDPTQFRAWLDR